MIFPETHISVKLNYCLQASVKLYSFCDVVGHSFIEIYMRRSRSLFFVLIFSFSKAVTAQSSPVSLRSDITIQLVMNVNNNGARIAKDPISGNFFYTTALGNIYEIKNINAGPSQTLLYTAADHGIDFLQGMAFMDSTLFLIGNKLIDSTENIGLIKKYVLQPGGLRSLINVAVTDTYPQSYTWYDHGFSGIAISPDKNYLYISSGSRTDHGEEQNNYGKYPGLREVPLTSAIFRIPANSVDLKLPKDEAALAPYLYADGVRNSFDLAFDANGNLFATENAGDRDDPEELNWIRQGRHYGYPWEMGGNETPQQYPGYVPDLDALINKKTNAYLKGYFYDDAAFPSKAGLTFTPPVKNLGPDADKYRESSGSVNDGSASGNNLNSFTPHRCPLGLSFDNENLLVPDLRGDAFVVSFSRGGDVSGLDIYGYPGTVDDSGEELLHLDLSPDGSDNYKMQVTAIANNFSYPVDTYLDDNLLYVIEHSTNGKGRLYKVILPQDVTGAMEHVSIPHSSVYPNPCKEKVAINLNLKNAGKINLVLYTPAGKVIYEQEEIKSPGNNKIVFETNLLSPGIYFYKIRTEGEYFAGKLVVEK